MDQTRHNDEILLIDYLLGQCDEDVARQVARRLDQDESFRQLHQDLSNTFGALQLSGQPEPPEGLTDKALSRIRSARRTQALLAKEEMSRPATRPTFTFRELVATAAAVLLLAIIFLPSIREARDVSLMNQCGVRVGQIGTALSSYANANMCYLPTAETPKKGWLRGGASNSAALFKLVDPRYRYESPMAFQCPAVAGPSFQVTAGMTDFPAAKYIAYSYHHSLGGQGLQRPSPMRQGDPLAKAPIAENMAILADSNPIFEGGTFHPDRLDAQTSNNHGGRGQNVLFLDMHVGRHTTPNVGVDGDNIYLRKSTTEYRGDEQPRDVTDSFLLPSFSPSE